MYAKSDLHDYQLDAIDMVFHKPKFGLFLDMGLGKTVSALTIADDLINDLLVSKILIIAPLSVANTAWKQQAEEWEHLNHLKINICTGPVKQRTAALLSDADIYVISRNSVTWMVDTFLKVWKWDMCIIDESSSFKDPTSKRFKSLRKVTSFFNSTILLSGTPAPNGYQDIWSQIYLLDNGKRLGKNITEFRKRYFRDVGYGKFSKYEILPGAEKEINKLVKDISITMSVEDHIDLPPQINILRYSRLSAKVNSTYEKFKKDLLLELDSCKNAIVAPNAAVLVGKLLQVCNGGIYDENSAYIHLHDDKIDILKEIIEENPHQNILVGYSFKSDKVRLQKAFPTAVILTKDEKILDSWNNGEIKLLLAQPSSCAYGLNIQRGGNIIVWFGLPWSLEIYLQFNARLHRQGQKNCVRVIHIITEGKIDSLVYKVLQEKDKVQKLLLNALKAEDYQAVADIQKNPALEESLIAALKTREY